MQLLATYYCCERAVGTGRLICQDCAQHPYPPDIDMTTIEQHIQAAGATKGPRITPADIETNIASQYFFTAADGAAGVFVHERAADGLGMFPGDLPTYETPLRLLTFCVLVLRNGFTVTGESACASPENFNPEVGRRIARENAVAKIWPLMGYELRSKLASQSTTFQDRVRAEAAELDERITKLKAFTSTETFGGLPVDEQDRMLAQLAAMSDYSACLAERIQAFAA